MSDKEEKIIEDKPSIISEATKVAERIEAANKRTEELMAEMQSNKVEDILGGKSDTTPEKAEETPEEYAKRVVNNDI